MFAASVPPMSIKGFLYHQYWRMASGRLKRKLLKEPGPATLDRADWSRSLTKPTEFYLDYFRYFYQRLPSELREHRVYFQQGRGWFGEDAMHVMWLALFQEFKPGTFLEIGVYRGQILSVAALLARRLGFSSAVHGISPFSPAGDAVSTYRDDVDYLKDTLANFRHFSLPQPELLRAFSTDPAAVALIDSRPWDMIYIDGNHDYEVVRRDWDVCSRAVKPGGIIVLDDAALNTAYRPPRLLATAGHPGPSRLAGEIDQNRFTEIIRVGHNRAFQRIS
jgi:SAM-dependent methyltransferase